MSASRIEAVSDGDDVLPSPRPIRGQPSPRIGDCGWRICGRGDMWAPNSAAGRWNHAGEAVIYASLSPALAALEAMAHRDGDDLASPHRLGWMRLPETGRCLLRVEDLPADWRERQALTREIGRRWLRRGEGVALFVPSALVPEGFNVLLRAGVVGACGEEAFHFDPRLR